MLALVKAGRGPEAVERARARVAEAPADPERLFTLGLAQSEQDVDEAIRTFRARHRRCVPITRLAHYNLALVLKRVDRAKDAIAELQRALAIEPRAEAHFALGSSISSREISTARAPRLKAAVAAEPRLVDAHIALGSVLKAKRQFPDAIDALRRAIALQPDLWSAHARAGDRAPAGRREGRGCPGGGGSRAPPSRGRARAGSGGRGPRSASPGSTPMTPRGRVEPFRRAMATFETYAPAHYQLGRALQRLGQDDGVARRVRTRRTR